jgi:F-type H+-transporting ATPase subunit a
LEILEHFFLEVIVPIKIGPIDISITNLVLSMFIGVGAFMLILVLFSTRLKIIPGKRQVVAELLVTFIKRGICFDMIGPKEGDRWVPLVASVFVFVLANNLVGLIPGLYTHTLNPVVPLVLALIVFLTVQITNFAKNGFLGYFKVSFAPPGVPKWMLVIVAPIEMISLIAKPFSLFIRLFANMLAGHTILAVILGLIIYFRSYLIAVVAVPFALVMTLLEIFVSAIQAYIFAILTALYISEVVNPKH